MSEQSLDHPSFDPNRTLSQLDLGGSDAESDVRLQDHFVTPPYVQAALRGKGRVFLGRKGSGKSGLWRSLPRLFEETAKVVLLSPDEFSTDSLREGDRAILTEEFANASAWRHSLVLEVALALLDSKAAWPQGALQSAERVRALLSQLYPGDATTLLRRMKEINISFMGFGLGLAKEASDARVKVNSIAPQILDELEPMLRERDVVIAVDKLDDTWDGSDHSKSLIIVLLKAAKYLNDRFSPQAGSRGLRVLTFLRSEIYRDLEFNDKDKLHPYEEMIEWTPQFLREMVSRRLPDGWTLDDLFEGGRMGDSQSPFMYILKRTFLRPREVLQFLDRCLRVADPDDSQIRRKDVREAEKRYSGWKVEDLGQEYLHVYPQLRRLLAALRKGAPSYRSRDELRAVLEKAGAIGVDVTFDQALAILFDVSVLGVRNEKNQGAVRFRAEDQDLVISEGSLHVHPSLHKGLGLSARNGAG